MWTAARGSTGFLHVDNSAEIIPTRPVPRDAELSLRLAPYPAPPEFPQRQEFSAAQGKKSRAYFRKPALKEFRSTLMPFKVCSNFCWIPTRMVRAVFQPPYCTGAGAR